MKMEIFGIDFGCAFGSLSDGKFPEKDCLLPLISKILGYCIVAASTTVKVPQILKILKNSSVRGLSLAAFELEVVGYTIALAYCLHNGLPFSAYGELLFLLVQAIVLVAIIYYFSQPLGMKTWIPALAYCALAPTILAGQVDPVLFEALYASQHAIFFCARVPQIWENFKSFMHHNLVTPICIITLLTRMTLAEQKHRGAQLLDLLNELCRLLGYMHTFDLNLLTLCYTFPFIAKLCRSHDIKFFDCSESLYQPPRTSSNKHDYGFCARYRDEWHHSQSDNIIPEATSEEREESSIEARLPAYADSCAWSSLCNGIVCMFLTSGLLQTTVLLLVWG
ncbi:hypothetical protein C5167_013807 [Papaver somniferum]|uniref:Mannose-P-dolichol utilization defect 1 protein homolog n=1 Tax=Papaver somniferum TaxID=3469 RepID=A0A4Y7J3C0_PAPSO|nr:hypothetical protein C5167_013807 [Papaver somniferum]